MAELVHRQRSAEDSTDSTDSTNPDMTDWFDAGPPEQRRFTEDTYPAARVPVYREEPDRTDGTTAEPPAPAERTGPQHAMAEDEPCPQHLARPGGGRLSTAGRIAGLALGLLALGGAVTTAWAMDRHTGQEPARATPRLEITGITALRPDAIAGRLGEEASGFAAGGTVNRASGSAPPGTNTDTRPQSPAKLVERFYALAGSTPAEAADLLAPALLGTNASDLLRSWQSVRAVRVERVTEEDGGDVLAVVRAQGSDGRWLRLRQRVGTTGDEAPQIDTVRVLSAQYG